MRFFAHDGKVVHGPAALEDLVKLPGFDGDTLVCPVGSENSADWKPALAYPPFREALLAPAPKLTPLISPPPPPSLALSCPKCARSNPLDARFCNACAARMDGREEPRGPKRAMANAREAEPEPAFVAVEALPAADPPASVPAPAPVPAPASSWRKALAASAAGAVIASGGLGWWLLRPAKRAAPPAAEAAPAPVPAAAPAPIAVPAPAAPAPVAAEVPPPAAKPEITAPPARRSPAKRARRKARAKKAAAASAPMAAPQKDTATVENADGGFLMPGVPRRVPPKSAAPPKADAAAPAAAAPAAAAAAAAEEAEDPASRQIREQFLFCTQLLAQGAYADHFDTCLCAAARQAAPYLGRRDAYAAALKKAAAAGTLEISASVTGVAVDGGGAKVTADWASGSTQRTETENWRLEDGLWCRDP